MDVWGLILSGLGAVLIAIGQEIVAGVTARWLRAHEAILGSFVGRSDADRTSGIDDEMDRAVAKSRLLSRVPCWLVDVCCRDHFADHSAFSPRRMARAL
jgi:hypothetical protein